MRKNKGITLITLIITIIISLILAGISIQAIASDNGLFKRAKETKQTQIESEMKEKLILAIDELQIEEEGETSLNNITEDYLQDKMPEYEVKLVSDLETSKKKVSIKKGEVQKSFILDENLNIIEIESSASELNFSYIESERNGDKIKVLITVEEKENGIEKIIFPDQDALICNNSKKTIGIDYIVNKGEEYKIKIILGNGAEKEETILIEDILIDYWPLTSNLNNAIQNRDNMEVTEGQVSFSDGVYLDGNTTIETINNYILPDCAFSVSIQIKDITKFENKRFAWILNMGELAYTGISKVNALGFIYDSFYPNLNFLATNGIWSATDNGKGKLYDDGNWHTLIGVYDSSSCILYNDFEKVGRYNNNLNRKINIDLSSKMGIGRADTTSSKFKGYFKELKIYNYALSEEEIEKLV